jgi:hypothetical protein
MSLSNGIFAGPPAGGRRAAVGLSALRWLAVAGLVAGLAACNTPHKPGNYLLDDIDEQNKVPDADWDALRSRLPPVPTATDTLLPIETLSKNDHFTYGVDPRSLKIDPGNIVRYTLVSTSDMGAKNISYESVRCGPNEWRTVAIVRQGAGWERATNDAWVAVTTDSIQQMVRGGVLCQGGGPSATTPEGLAKRLRSWQIYSDSTISANSR